MQQTWGEQQDADETFLRSCNFKCDQFNAWGKELIHEIIQHFPTKTVFSAAYRRLIPYMSCGGILGQKAPQTHDLNVPKILATALIVNICAHFPNRKQP